MHSGQYQICNVMISGKLTWQALKQIYFSHRPTRTNTDRGWQWNLELGMRPPASPSCRLYEPEAIGAYAYPPACKPYGLYGLEAAPVGRRNKGSLRLVAVRCWRQNSWKSWRSKNRRFFGGMRNRGCFETGSLEWFNYEF